MPMPLRRPRRKIPQADQHKHTQPAIQDLSPPTPPRRTPRRKVRLIFVHRERATAVEEVAEFVPYPGRLLR